MEPLNGRHLTKHEAMSISARAGQIFQPSTPINNRELFAGRWDLLTAVADAVGQVGLHVIIHGERGVGKTSIANVVGPLLHVLDEQSTVPKAVAGERLVIKINASNEDTFSSLWNAAFSEIEWIEVAESFGFSKGTTEEWATVGEHFRLPTDLGQDNVRRVLAKMPGSVFVFDEFDRLSKGRTRPFTDLIKALSDFSVESTVVIVGVSDTVEALVADHASIVRAVRQLYVPRMKPDELREILSKAEEALGIAFDDDAAARIVHISQGLPHYTHLLGLHSVRAACSAKSSAVRIEHVHSGFEKALAETHQSVSNKYAKATHSSQPTALHERVLLACAIAATSSADEHGFFQPSHVVRPLGCILGKEVEFSTFNGHLSAFCQKDRAAVLERMGRERTYRYRFTDPLLPPYAIMKGVTGDAVTINQIDDLTKSAR